MCLKLTFNLNELYKGWAQSRISLKLNLSETSCPSRGTKLLIFNSSAKDLVIYRIEIKFYRKVWWGLKATKRQSISLPEAEGFLNLTIQPNNNHVIKFEEANHFYSGDQKVKAFLHIIGRRKPKIYRL